jgi:hypothetical protein
MKVEGFDFEVKWKNDCQDKQDFDINVLQILTRYYGRDNTARPTIYLGETLVKEYDGWIQGDDEEETKRLTEEWIKTELAKIISKIKSI